MNTFRAPASRIRAVLLPIAAPGPTFSTKEDQIGPRFKIMILLSKLTDYGVTLMTRLAQRREEGCLSARDLAESSGLPLPTVSKLLKILARRKAVTEIICVEPTLTITEDVDRGTWNYQR